MPHITSAQVAERLSVTSRHVTRLVQDGTLKPVQKLPGKTGAYLFRSEDVDVLTERGAA